MDRPLVPCPWCGETDRKKIIRRTLNGNFYIDHFDAVFHLQSSLVFDTEEEAADAWDKRVGYINLTAFSEQKPIVSEHKTLIQEVEA